MGRGLMVGLVRKRGRIGGIVKDPPQVEQVKLHSEKVENKELSQYLGIFVFDTR